MPVRGRMILATNVEQTFGVSNPIQGQEIFLFSKTPRPALWSIQPPIPWVPSSFPDGKAAGELVDHSPALSSEVTEEGSWISAHLIRLHAVDRQTVKSPFPKHMDSVLCHETHEAFNIYLVKLFLSELGAPTSATSINYVLFYAVYAMYTAFPSLCKRLKGSASRQATATSPVDLSVSS